MILRVGGEFLRIGFKTTIEEDLITQLKIDAITNKVDVNDILEQLIEKYLSGEIELKFSSKK